MKEDVKDCKKEDVKDCKKKNVNCQNEDMKEKMRRTRRGEGLEKQKDQKRRRTKERTRMTNLVSHHSPWQMGNRLQLVIDKQLNTDLV